MNLDPCPLVLETNLQDCTGEKQTSRWHILPRPEREVDGSCTFPLLEMYVKKRYVDMHGHKVLRLFMQYEEENGTMVMKDNANAAANAADAHDDDEDEDEDEDEDDDDDDG